MIETTVQVDDVLHTAEVMLIPVDPAISEESRIIDAAFDLLNADGKVTLTALRKRLHWNSRRYADLQAIYGKWHMQTWENGEEN